MEMVWMLLGLIVGGAAGIFLGLRLGRGAVAGQVPALEATLAEVRGQASTKETELAALREALENQKIAGAEANARLEAAREHFAEQRRQIEEMEKKVKDTFTALSTTALKSSNEQFLTLAEARMKPLREQLLRYEQYIKELEKTRSEAYGGLSKHLTSLEDRSDRLGRETSQLVAALRQSGAKGKWGEATLQRIVELSGMSKHCDFDTQSTLAGGQRPDLVVRLPGGRMLAIDSKVNTSAYLDAMNATDEVERNTLMTKYAGEVRNTLKALGGKEYWKQLSPAPEFVVMFMPGEAFFAAAMSQDTNLLVDGIDKGVILASPTTLIALLLAVRHGWRQQDMAENAERIAAAGRELYGRLCKFVEHLGDIRVGIEKAAKAYDDAVGNWERRTLPSVRKLKDLGTDGGNEMHELKPAEVQMRPVLPIENDE
jgi:DNA recombination protein RmuC